MNLMDLFIKIGVDDQATSKISKITQSVGNGLKTAAKVGTAAIGAAASGLAALTTVSVKQYSEYEQLVGGAELMFGKAFETVEKNAKKAYSTVQMSQSEYLKQVNGFATGLKTALGGNEEAAAELSHKIIKAEADIIAATGNTAENVQNAFNGIMRNNFAMLDNLQIGITPTKEGFQEVIDKVNEWNASMGKMTNYQMGNLADMQSALVDYIDMVGMSGYAQEEAAKTITGSLASAKAAWTNLITGLSDDNANFGQLVSDFVGSVGTAADNLLPKVEAALEGVVQLVQNLFPKIAQMLPSLISTLLPLVANGAVSIVKALASSLSQNSKELVKSAIDAVNSLITGVLSMLGDIANLGLELIVSLALGIANAIPNLIPVAIDVVSQIVDTLTNPDTLSKVLNAALVIIMSLVNGFLNPNSTEKVYNTIFTLVDNIVEFLLNEENLSKIINAAIQIVVAFGLGMTKQRVELLKIVMALIGAIVVGIFTTNWIQIGVDVVMGILDGLKNKWSTLKNWFTDAWDGLVSGVKNLLGIHSPSRVFADIGKNMALGVGEGWSENFSHIKDDINKSLDFGNASLGVSTYKQSDVFGESIRGGGVSVIQNIYAEAKTAADLMEEATYRLQVAEMGAS